MQDVIRAVLWAFALVNLAYGVFALFDAQRAARLVRLHPETRAARGEIRALYGGLVIALGLMTIVGLRRPEGWVVIEALGIAFAGLAAGRVGALLLDGFSRWNAWLLVGEGGAAVFLFWAAPQLAA